MIFQQKNLDKKNLNYNLILQQTDYLIKFSKENCLWWVSDFHINKFTMIFFFKEKLFHEIISDFWGNDLWTKKFIL